MRECPNPGSCTYLIALAKGFRMNKKGGGDCSYLQPDVENLSVLFVLDHILNNTNGTPFGVFKCTPQITTNNSLGCEYGRAEK